jgi:hypothetical protein
MLINLMPGVQTTLSSAPLLGSLTEQWSKMNALPGFIIALIVVALALVREILAECTCCRCKLCQAVNVDKMFMESGEFFDSFSIVAKKSKYKFESYLPEKQAAYAETFIRTPSLNQLAQTSAYDRLEDATRTSYLQIAMTMKKLKNVLKEQKVVKAQMREMALSAACTSFLCVLHFHAFRCVCICVFCFGFCIWCVCCMLCVVLPFFSEHFLLIDPCLIGLDMQIIRCLNFNCFILFNVACFYILCVV